MSNDRLSASWVLLVGAIAVGYWFYTLDPLRRKTLLHSGAGGSAGATTPADVGATLGGVPTVDPGASIRDPVTGATVAAGAPLAALLGFASAEGLTVTSTTGGSHTPTSLHYQGRAIDVGVSGLSSASIAQKVQDALNAGFKVLQELYTGNGRYGYSSGPHLHISDPAPGTRGVSYQDPAQIIAQTTGGIA